MAGGCMMRVRKAKIFEAARGFFGRRKNTWTNAIRAVHRAWQFAYIGRRQKKRNARQLWIQKINAGCRQFGMTYSQLVRFLPAAGMPLDRKVLADLAVTEPYTFRALVEVARMQKATEAAAAAKPDSKLAELR